MSDITPYVEGPMQFGKIKDEPADVYHAADALSNSKLKNFSERPLYFWRKHVAKLIKQEETRPLRVGRAVDAWILEGPAVFHREFIVVPVNAPKVPTSVQRAAAKPAQKSIDAMLWWDDFAAIAQDRCILSQVEWAEIARLEETLRSSPEVWAALNAGESQITWRKDYGNGIVVQVRTDVWCPNGISRICDTACIVDLKSCVSLSDSSFSSFNSQFSKLGYYRQAGLYTAVISEILPAEERPVDGLRFFFAAAEKGEPFAAQLYEASQEDITLGFRESVDAIEQVTKCYQTGVWPGSLGGVQMLHIPAWHRRKVEERLDGEQS